MRASTSQLDRASAFLKWTTIESPTDISRVGPGIVPRVPFSPGSRSLMSHGLSLRSSGTVHASLPSGCAGGR